MGQYTKRVHGDSTSEQGSPGTAHAPPEGTGADGVRATGKMGVRAGPPVTPALPRPCRVTGAAHRLGAVMVAGGRDRGPRWTRLRWWLQRTTSLRRFERKERRTPPPGNPTAAGWTASERPGPVTRRPGETCKLLPPRGRCLWSRDGPGCAERGTSPWAGCLPAEGRGVEACGCCAEWLRERRGA